MTQRSEKIGSKISIYLRGNVWYATWQEGIKQRRQSLKTRNVKEARRLAHLKDAEIVAGDGRTIQPALIADVKEAFLQQKRVNGKAPKTMAQYEQTLKEIQDFALRLGRQRMDQLDLNFSDQYLSELHAAGRKSKTIKRKLVLLRGLVKFALARHLLQADPLSGLELPRAKPDAQPCWTREEVDQILAACEGYQRDVFELLAETGMRIGEVQWLTWKWISGETSSTSALRRDGNRSPATPAHFRLVPQPAASCSVNHVSTAGYSPCRPPSSTLKAVARSVNVDCWPT